MQTSYNVCLLQLVHCCDNIWFPIRIGEEVSNKCKLRAEVRLGKAQRPAGKQGGPEKGLKVTFKPQRVVTEGPGGILAVYMTGEGGVMYFFRS